MTDGSDLYEVMRCAPSTRNFTAEPVARELSRKPVSEFAVGDRVGVPW